MSTAHSLTRIEILSQELVERGMQSDDAADLSLELMARHPFAGRYGVPALIDEIERRGVQGSRAEETALMLLGVELLIHGASFGQLVGALERRGLGAPAAHGTALESSRLFRAILAGRPSTSTSTGEAALGWGVCLLVLGSALAALLHHTF